MIDYNMEGSGYKPPVRKKPTDEENPETQGFYAPQAPKTFAEMQKAGQARPAPPSIEQPGIPPVYGQMAPPTGGPSVTPQIPQPKPGMEDQLRGAWEGYQGSGPFQPQGVPIGANPFTDPNQGSPFSGALMGSIMGGLNSPSRYDSNVVKDSYGWLSGQIDDDFNARDQDLRTSIASRGLGSVGDSSIGTADQRFQNMQRRGAKENLASMLLREQANTYGNDRANAIAQAMGYGQNQFGNALNTAGFNRDSSQQNFGNQLATFNANQNNNAQNFAQRQQLLQNLLGYGQQSFQNQLASAQFNANQDESYRNWLQSILGGR